MSDIIGKTLSKGLPVSLSQEERDRHVYLAGKTGAGKTTVLENMAHAAILAGEGVSFIDPHGDSAQRLIDSIPKHRVTDTIYFNPLDPHPVSFNPVPLDVPVLDRNTAATELVVTYKHVWKDTWGTSRLQHNMTMAMRLLLDNPQIIDEHDVVGPASIIHLNRIFVDPHFRERLLSNCSDEYVKSFWVDEYGAMPEKEQREQMKSTLNKTGQFSTDPRIRRVMGQASTINIADIMDTKKILICNLSKQMGETPAKLIGSALVTAFGQAALARQRMPERERVPHNLFIDECHNYAGGMMETILSEARKYKLRLTLGNQYLKQIEDLAPAIFGNVGTIIAFRVGAKDAAELAPEFYQVQPETLVSQSNFTARLTILRDGTPVTTDMRTVPSTLTRGSAEQVRRWTRANYTRQSQKMRAKTVSIPIRSASQPRGGKNARRNRP